MNIDWSQIIGGFFGALFAFLAAYGLYLIQKRDRMRAEVKRLWLKVIKELENNIAILKLEIDSEHLRIVATHPLSDVSWNVDVLAAINVSGGDSSDLVNALQALYLEIRELNNFIAREQEAEKGLASSSGLSPRAGCYRNNKGVEKLLKKMQQMKAYIFRRLVDEKILKENSWPEDTQDWKNAENPYGVGRDKGK